MVWRRTSWEVSISWRVRDEKMGQPRVFLDPPARRDPTEMMNFPLRETVYFSIGGWRWVGVCVWSLGC